ncbi:MAG TPA: sigma-70 family RNA polymerase sigma factor [Pseudonocardia sp.]|uniref:sigma-70 family RNA polymerase sigma factor n=1 Tax=Pseudonocardia sp. TaxID=60912 RepID=UPI002CC9FEF1|nr:sigma-70 family RNA polymerase sigma factor [Pseudonocardia sp.]HTF55612.1 sigma-70 family RNA polymerase sigma factor [Pseudonocardia sp.]
MTRSDAELLRAHLAGDRAAFHELTSRYQSLLWNFAQYWLHCREDAEEAVQDTLTRAYQAAASCRADDSIRGWLVQILKNICTDRQRHNRSRPAEPVPGEVLEQLPAPRNPIADHELRMDVRTALAELPREQRIVLTLVEMGYQVSEVAAVLGIAVGTVKSRGARGRIRMGQILSPDRPLQPATEER